MNKNARPSPFVALLSLLFMLSSPMAFAHKVSVFAYVEDNSVFVEGYFADGKKAMNSDVTVFANGDELVFEGTTNDQGLIDFPLPKVESELRIALNAGAGHRGEYVIPAEEVKGALETEEAVAHSTVAPPADEKAAPAQIKQEKGDSGAAAGTAAIDPVQLEVVVKHAVAEAIKPLVRELAASQEHVSFTQKVGGIGYIFGVLGIFAYLAARKKEAAAKKA